MRNAPASGTASEMVRGGALLVKGAKHRLFLPKIPLRHHQLRTRDEAVLQYRRIRYFFLFPSIDIVEMSLLEFNALYYRQASPKLSREPSHRICHTRKHLVLYDLDNFIQRSVRWKLQNIFSQKRDFC
mmetsp:Transcript_3084/g.8555  ORF Transcript_3084/g.8555 Transcript_3084/m.8555 type:complete len:128 (-) Transcript_3084:678-1061(-)